MRKLFTIATALLVGSVGFAQTQGGTRVVKRPIQNVSALPRVVEEPNVPLMMRQGNGIQSTIPSYSTDAVTSQKIASSANYFGYSNNGQKQSYIINDLDAVAFVFRNNSGVSGAGNSGHLRYNISSNRGATWAVPTTGAGIGNINPTQPKLARYPNCVLFTDPTGGTTAQARFGAIGAALNSSGSGWEGYVKIVVGPNVFTNITTPVVEQEDYALLEGPVFPQHITERVPGEFWATMYGDTNNDTIYVLKGTYSAAAQGINWTYNDKLMPAWNTAVDGSAHANMPKIEFAPDGKVGYVAMVGDLVGGQDSAYVPILFDYDESTDHFGAGYELDIKQFSQLTDFISSFTDSIGNPPFSPNGTPTTAFNFDLTVDYKGNPHIMCIIGPASSGVPSNTAAYSISSGFALQIMDITKDYTGSWNMIKLWDQMTFREDLPSASAATSLDPTMNLARSEDGKYIFYHWSDTDTTGNPTNNANDAPNLKGAFYDAENDMISAVTDWTFDDAIWVGNAQGPKTPARVFETGTSCPGRTFNVPTIVSDIPSGDPATVTDNFYFSDINYDCSDANQTPSWFYTCAMSPMTIAPTVVEPACGTNSGSIDLTNAVTGGIPAYTYDLLSPAGTSLGTGPVYTGLGAGAYTVIVVDSFGCDVIDIINLNNAGAPLGVISNTVAPTCATSNNGSATVCWTGGTNPVTVVWYDGNGNIVSGGVTTGNCNTNSSLPGGSIVAVLSDANTCIGTASTTLAIPNPLAVAYSAGGSSCNGADDGSIILAVSGGSGTPSFAWTVPAGVTNPGNASVATGLAPGDYAVVVTANGCTETTGTITLTEPTQVVATGSITFANTNCASPYNGVICLSVSGGTGAGTYTYTWTGVSGSNPNFIPTVNGDCIENIPGGTYTVTINDGNDCTTDAPVVVVMTGCQVGIDNSLNNVTAFSAYPNPATNVLNISMNLAKAEKVEIALVNTAGQVIVSKTFENNTSIAEQFNVANLAKGVYFLKVTTAEGTAADKVVIK